ncbi:MAG: hypothetical protein ABI016_09435 [Chthoniobacterales bacterium]
MHVPGAFSLNELIRQAPGLEKKQPERLEKARVEIEKRVRGIGQKRAERAAVIHPGLAALGAVGPGQRRAAILAMGQR